MRQLALLQSSQFPPGFSYYPDFLTALQEQHLIEEIQKIALKGAIFREWVARRRVASFGWEYDARRGRSFELRSIPKFLLPLRTRVAKKLNLPVSKIVHALVTEYRPGAPIGWHRDRPEFGEIAGVSLANPCLFRLRPRREGKIKRSEIVEFVAEPRSLYLMRGVVRHTWEHSIPPVPHLRYSITFRTVA